MPLTDDEFACQLEAALPVMRKIARAYMAAGDDPEDIAQSAALLAWRHRAQFRGEAKFTNWLHSVVRNTVFSMRRAASARPLEVHPVFVHKRLYNARGDVLTDNVTVFVDPADERIIPADQQAADHERWTQLLKLILRLSPKQQAALKIRLEDRQSLETNSTVKVHVSRAIRKLRIMHAARMTREHRQRAALRPGSSTAVAVPGTTPLVSSSGHPALDAERKRA